ncbi:hypothetical protein GCM10010885_12400 [Alicyclobacillus cellulosilyticus]|uniref:Ribosome-binding factor A n=1 Tax=Alicyclobacillus cellulosilyticus TaxID=1003997 RepID=A0A917K940_9BACL|nr:30S ribosome-binding factor RbfA [Alicyclobacillus cellulosilyticus]GGJ04779.1 hypothetical protein GCM10010885_12400 [Alicyclobacillus cellulosilyticus]
MARIRTQRVAEEMKKELADIIRYELKDPRIGFATITRVEVSPDLQYARVYVSVLGDTETKKHTLQALAKASGYIRGEVTRRLHLRLAPEMVFKEDDSGEYSARIEQVLRELRGGSPPEGLAAPGGNHGLAPDHDTKRGAHPGEASGAQPGNE